MPGPARKPDALRRNPEHKRNKLADWRAANADQFAETRRKNQVAREERYRQNPAYYLWRTAKWRARQAGVAFEIEVSDVVVPDTCPITGEAIAVLCGGHRNGASLDRVDNRLGYVKGNVRVISRKANRMKGDLTLADLDRIAAYIRGEI